MGGKGKPKQMQLRLANPLHRGAAANRRLTPNGSAPRCAQVRSR